MTTSERSDRRTYHFKNKRSMVDHTYSSTVIQSSENMAAEIKRLKLLAESLSGKLSQEKMRRARVQRSLMKACSMLEQCSEYEFFDHNGRKIARPRDSTRKTKTLIENPYSSRASKPMFEDVNYQPEQQILLSEQHPEVGVALVEDLQPESESQSYQDYFEQNAEAVAIGEDGIIYRVISEDTQNLGVNFVQESSILMEPSAAVATAAVNPDGTEKVEFVNILS